jgi:hypothetical protein
MTYTRHEVVPDSSSGNQWFVKQVVSLAATCKGRRECITAVPKHGSWIVVLSKKVKRVEMGITVKNPRERDIDAEIA